MGLGSERVRLSGRGGTRGTAGDEPGQRIPMRLGRQRGRKRILAPDGSELTPPTKPQPDGVLVKALARAWRWQKLLDRGVYSSVTEIAEAEKISKSYVSRILRLALLAPDIVEAILGGWADQRVMLERLERPLPVGWEEQRASLVGPLETTATASGRSQLTASPPRVGARGGTERGA